MSLNEKVAKINKELEDDKSKKAETAQESELKPVRARIKELEKEKFQLEQIKGTLELKSGSGSGSGKGMREYGEEVEKETDTESKKLDTLIETNKEAFATMNVTNKEELEANADLKDEPEVVRYKEAKKRSTGVKTSDTALIKKLNSLGIELSADTFSYNTAEKMVEERMKSLEKELLQEKIKTPEGKEEVISTLAKTLETQIPIASIGMNDTKTEQTLNLNNTSRDQIVVSDSKIKYAGSGGLKLLPENAKVLEETFPKEIVQVATVKAYENKIDAGFTNLDEKTKNFDRAVKEDLERSSPEKWQGASAALREFETVHRTFLQTLKAKTEELKQAGIDFNPDHSNYGGSYATYAALAEYDQDNKLIEETRNDPTKYPPRLYFDALKEHTEKRIADVKEYTEALQTLKTKEDIRTFNTEKGGISIAHSRQLENKFVKVYRPTYSPNTQSWENTKAQEILKFKSYQEAEKYFKEKSKERQDTKNKFLNVIETKINTANKLEELRAALNETGFTKDVSSVASEINRLETNKNQALTLMSELTKMQSTLPNEEVVMNGTEIKVPSAEKRLLELGQQTKEKKQELVTLKQTIAKKKNNKPMMFGIKDWQIELDNLKKDQVALEAKIYQMENSEYRDLSNKILYRIPLPEYSDLQKIIQDQGIRKGTPNEIFTDLKTKLNEIMEHKAPESVVRLNKEYEELKKQFS